jgi:hypothetical protein
MTWPTHDAGGIAAAAPVAAVSLAARQELVNAMDPRETCGFAHGTRL